MFVKHYRNSMTPAATKLGKTIFSLKSQSRDDKVTDLSVIWKGIPYIIILLYAT